MAHFPTWTYAFFHIFIAMLCWEGIDNWNVQYAAHKPFSMSVVSITGFNVIIRSEKCICVIFILCTEVQKGQTFSQLLYMIIATLIHSKMIYYTQTAYFVCLWGDVNFSLFECVCSTAFERAQRMFPVLYLGRSSITSDHRRKILSTKRRVKKILINGLKYEN